MSYSVITDERPIASICWNTEDGACYQASASIKIEAYGEPGMSCDITYFAVKENGIVLCRVPAWQVSVHYEVKP